LELHSRYKGQFFTPQHICDFMGMVALGENDPDINKKGFLSASEPCCGSGAMILGFAKAMQKNGYNFHKQMVITATDVDIKCVYMCYLQLSLYGIPAVVIHGNTLSMEEWSRWYTPVYMLDGWVWKRACGNIDKRYPEDEAIKQKSDPAYAAIRKAEALFETNTLDVVEKILPDTQEPCETVSQLQLDGEITSFAVAKKQHAEKRRARSLPSVEMEQMTLF
jgi:hypothetical protein